MGKVALEGGLAQGKRLVANVSRTVVGTCLERYGGAHEVYCLLITAPNEVKGGAGLRAGGQAVYN